MFVCTSGCTITTKAEINIFWTAAPFEKFQENFDSSLSNVDSIFARRTAYLEDNYCEKSF